MCLEVLEVFLKNVLPYFIYLKIDNKKDFKKPEIILKNNYVITKKDTLPHLVLCGSGKFPDFFPLSFLVYKLFPGLSFFSLPYLNTFCIFFNNQPGKLSL